MQSIYANSTTKYPLPKGNSAYARAKRAEYIQKDTSLAKAYYRESISRDERVESSVKDLASLLHQEGKTKEAVQLIEAHLSTFADQQKAGNLLLSLKEKLVPKGNLLNKFIKVSGLDPYDSTATIKSIFRDPSRITSIEITGKDEECSALVKFGSHSAARKTLSTLCRWSHYRIEWVSVDGSVIGNVYNPWYKESRELADLPRRTAIHLLGKDLFELLA